MKGEWREIGFAFFCAFLFVGFVAFMTATAVFWIADRQREQAEQRRQARYDACLERTLPDICELHMIPWSRDVRPEITIVVDPGSRDER